MAPSLVEASPDSETIIPPSPQDDTNLFNYLPQSSDGSIKSLFSPREVSLLPGNIGIAMERAEHRKLVRHQLHRLKMGAKELDGPTTAGDGASRRSMRRQRYGKVLGQLGYEQLALKPLAVVDKQVKHRRNVAGELAADARPRFGDKQISVEKGGESVNTCMKRIVGEIQDVAWLNQDEKENLTNTLISDLAIRYNHIQELLPSHISSAQCRALGIKVFRHIGLIKDAILERCRRKKIRMENAGMFRDELNSGRLQALFRLELCRRIDTEELVKEAVAETEGGKMPHELGVYPKWTSDPLKAELQEFKEALDRATHPIPQLHAPTILGKHQPNVLRKLMRESSISTDQRRSNDMTRRASLMTEQRRTSLAVDSVTQRYAAAARDLANLGCKRKPDVAAAADGAVSKRGTLWGDGIDEEEDDEDDESEDDDDDDDEKADAIFEGLAQKEDPVLQAHTELSLFRRRQEPPEQALEKHLKPTPATRPPQHRQGYTETVLDDSESLRSQVVLRSMDSRVSVRVPRGFINLAAEPAAAVSEFGSEMDSSLLGNLDEKLTRYKEVEELYDEIMKTISHTHLDTDEAEGEDINGCPSAPFHPGDPISYAYQGVMPPSLIRPISRPPPPEPTERKRSGPTIRLRTREGRGGGPAGVIVSPDDFIRDRDAAMRKAPSSRYNTFRYNYGGYIPFDVEKRRAKIRDNFGVRDFFDYLRTQSTTFVFDLLYKEDEEAERLRKEQEEAEALRRDEEERRRIEREKEEKQEKRRKMLAYRRGEWNPGIMEFMAELHDAEKTELETDEDTDASAELEAETGVKEESADEDVVSPSVLDQMPRSTPTTPSLRPDSIDIQKSQEELEALWVTLKMPLDQKLDMAIKYGSHKFAPKLQTAIRLWKAVSQHIIAREALLAEIETFERVASDPTRFFKKGPEGSSEARLKEAREREDLMRRLHYVEARIQDVVSMIKRELHESVTYEGAPYLEKMKWDYAEIIKRLQRQRAETARTASGDDRTHELNSEWR
ncbi:Coiled-coil domain-containing protein 87 [Borealophlyctis nickersoniae]|nr:Coiled-coil domain-containing protein 87 [Borealophlyctis nickersoniae]